MTNDAKVARCSVPRVLALAKVGRQALFALVLLPRIACGQEASPNPATKKTAVHRANELTLAGLRPGKDTAGKAIQMYGKVSSKNKPGDSQLLWGATCQTQNLLVDLDDAKRIQVIRAVEAKWAPGDCPKLMPGSWKTGLGLQVGDATPKLERLYGAPDSKSPSTRDGQPLELWYYAFDWAGENVPQVMEVLCTREVDGKPGRVVEITLAAPSL